VSDDLERDFYEVLSALGADASNMVTNVKKDMFDSSLGLQVGLNAAGNVVLCLPMTPATAMMVVQAWEAYADHQCEAGLECLLAFLMSPVFLLSQIKPALPGEVQDARFFDHKDN
jgi:hypothetical protein